MASTRLLLALLSLTACRAGEVEPDAKASSSDAVSDSGDAWYAYDEDDPYDEDEEDEESEGKEEEEDEKGENSYGGEECPEDFSSDEPCEGSWEDGVWCVEGDTIWYCEDGTWLKK